jgi:hypothetical protein
VAEHLGVARAADIKTGRRKLTAEEVAQINNWISVCEVAWRKCTSKFKAIDLEDKMKSEYLPPLTKR